MAQQDKSFYWQALKEAGVEFEKHYREYTEAELKSGYDQAIAAGRIVVRGALEDEPPSADFFGLGDGEPDGPALNVPVAHANPNEMAGARLNTKDDEEPIRIDPETGRVWYQEEVLKPSFPKARGRRVLTYTETGTETRTVTNGQYQETFEVAGNGPATTAQVKVTLPSYQVGICRDPRLPFKIHTYNGLEGFDFFEVNAYYGGVELVPAECKRMYVENALCYDIRSVVAAINNEYRQLQLAGKV